MAAADAEGVVPSAAAFVTVERAACQAGRLENALRVARPERREVLMGTIAETWLDQGREEGLAEGLAEGRAEGLSLLLERRFGPLPAGIRSRIGSAGSGQLRAWFESAIGADSLASVFGPGAMD